MAKIFRSTSARVVAVLVALAGAYMLAGFLLAPALVRDALTQELEKALGVRATVGDIRVNPLQLRIEIRDFSLADTGGGKLVGFERLELQVRWASLWRRMPVIGDAALDAPFVNAVTDANGKLNLMQLRPRQTEPSRASGDLPRFEIMHFAVNRGSVSFADHSRSPLYQVRLQPVNFELRDFSSGAEGGAFAFEAATDRQEHIEWHGHLRANPVESDGQIRIRALEAHTAWDYLRPPVGFALSSGKVDLSAHYRFALHGATELQVDGLRLAVKDLGIRPPGGDTDWILVPTLEAGPATVNLAARDAAVEAVTVQGLKLLVVRAADNSVNLARLAASPPPAATATPAPAPAPAAGAGPAPWHLKLGEFKLLAANVAFEDRSATPAAHFTFSPLSLKIDGASLDLAQPLRVSLDTGVNTVGHLGIAGTVIPAPLTLDLQVGAGAVELPALQPYIGQFSALTVLAGRMSSDLKVHYEAAKPALTVAGDLSVDGLHTVSTALHDDFINWQRLEVNRLTYQQTPGRLRIARIGVQKPYARVIIEADSTVNLHRILGGEPPAPTAGARPPPGPPAKATPMDIAIDEVAVTAGELDFSDLSVQPNFAAGVKKLQGGITGLSSRPESRAKMDFHGEVDAYSPVTIAGNVNLMSPVMYTDVEMGFRNIELSIFNPYAGKFAGYDISKGKLTTTMHYTVAGTKLEARHHVTIDQLEFGDKTASKDAVSLPVKLAVSLLKDRNGRIDLDIPVSGSLSDPQFSIGPAIRKVLGNLVAKLVTAPFALLGSLFSSGPDLQFVDFQPGSGVLDAAGLARIKTVAKALAERPQLEVDLPIATLPELDRPALAAARLAALPPGKQQPVEVSDDDLVALAQQRALALKEAFLNDTEVKPERVFLVSNNKVKAEQGLVRLEMALR